MLSPRSAGAARAPSIGPACLEGRSDAELMALAAEGHRQALSKLYSRYARLLLAVALRMLRDRSDAEDVLQDVFLYVWQKARAYDAARSSVATWLLVITRSRSLDRIKRNRRRSRKILATDVDEAGEAKAWVAGDFEAGFERVLGLQRWKHVVQELQRLPEPQRQVLELLYFHGLSLKEVAERTRAPLGTVKTRTLLGLRKLRRAVRRRDVVLRVPGGLR